jgi:hypothetical protein
MANHLRRQIREGIAAAVTGLPTTGSHAFSSRVYPLADADLPAVSVYCLDEAAVAQTIHPQRVFGRTVNTIIEGVAKATADLDDILDQIAKEVELALCYPVPSLAGIAKLSTLTNTNIDLIGTAERPLGRIRLTYSIEYFAAENAPDVAL